MAQVKHSQSTGHTAQMALARRTSTEVSEGRCRRNPSYSLPKKISGSMSRHLALAPHGWSGMSAKGSSSLECLTSVDDVLAIEGNAGGVHEILIFSGQLREKGVRLG